jgi:hypothetical protein
MACPEIDVSSLKDAVNAVLDHIVNDLGLSTIRIED